MIRGALNAGFFSFIIFVAYLLLSWFLFPFARFAFDYYIRGNSKSSGITFFSTADTIFFIKGLLLAFKIAIYFLILEFSIFIAPIGMMKLAKHGDLLHKSGLGDSFTAFGYEIAKTKKEDFLKDYPNATLTQMNQGYKLEVNQHVNSIPSSTSFAAIFDSNDILHATIAYFPITLRDAVCDGIIKKYGDAITDSINDKDGCTQYILGGIRVLVSADEGGEFYLAYASSKTDEIFTTKEEAAVQEIL